MSESSEAPGDGLTAEVESRFRLVIVAALRSKQLLRGARPRVAADPHKRRDTSIALEEVRQGPVPYSITEADGAGRRS